jgi:rare lipoprotein A (peptidoglycan hydrolase)
LKKQGRIIDLSKAAFAKIADLKKGLIRVEIEKVKNGN